jgi:hypothetical protein
MYEIIYIEWCDAITNHEPWMSRTEALEWANTRQWVNKHIGFIVDENDEYILIAGEIGQMTEDEPQLGHVTKIPKTWILKRLILSL